MMFGGGGTAGKKYSLTASVQASNALNHTNFLGLQWGICRRPLFLANRSAPGVRLRASGRRQWRVADV